MLVKDLMTRDPLTVSAAATVADARHLAGRHRVSHLPVVEHGRLLGMLAWPELWDDTTDILRAAVAGGFRGDADRRRSAPDASHRGVRGVMQPAYPVARPESQARSAAQLMLLKDRTGVAVLDDRSELVGIVTVADVRHGLEYAEGHQPSLAVAS